MTDEGAKSPRGASAHWYQYRLSTLLLTVLIVALALGWWVDRSRLAKQIPAQPQGVKIFSVVHADATDLSGDSQGTVLAGRLRSGIRRRRRADPTDHRSRAHRQTRRSGSAGASTRPVGRFGTSP